MRVRDKKMPLASMHRDIECYPDNARDDDVNNLTGSALASRSRIESESCAAILMAPTTPCLSCREIFQAAANDPAAPTSVMLKQTLETS